MYADDFSSEGSSFQGGAPAGANILKTGWNQLKLWLFDTDCPMASLVVWIGFFMMFYYAFVMPDSNVAMAEKGINVTQVRGNIRAILATVWIVGSLVAWFFVKSMCNRSGNDWRQVIWGIVAVSVLSLLSVLILTITQDKWKIQSSAEFINFLNKQQSS